MTSRARLTYRYFRPRSKLAEVTMLREDDEDFIVTKYYIDGLIHQTLDPMRMPPMTRDRVHELLLDDVEVAARRFLRQDEGRQPKQKFSTYFIWYINERLKKLKV